MREGQPVFYLFNEVTNFLDQVGTNTQYIIHPEEILADNFTELMMGQSEVPDQWLLDEMKTFLISE